LCIDWRVILSFLNQFSFLMPKRSRISFFLSARTISICRNQNIDVESFQAGSNWIKRLKKVGAFFASKNHQDQLSVSLPNPISDQFSMEVKNIMIELGVSCVWDIDQTSVNYETIPSRTSNEIDSNNV
jgi:hypothetical protein